MIPVDKVKLDPTISKKKLVGMAAKVSSTLMKGESTDQIDATAWLVREKFRQAHGYKSTCMVGENSVLTLIDKAFEQYHSTKGCNAGCDGEGNESPEAKQIALMMGIDIKFSITKDMVDVAVAAIKDLMLSQQDMPFDIDGSPIPELPAALKERVLEELAHKYTTQEVLGDNPRQQVWEEAEVQKDKLLKIQQDMADRIATNHTTLAFDQLLQGGFHQEFADYIFNLCLYPYAVFTGPTVEYKSTPVWNGDKLVAEDKLVYCFKNIHPKDYYWSPDTKEAGTGEYDIILSSITRGELMRVRSQQGFITESIDYILAGTTNSTQSFKDWLIEDSEEYSNFFDDSSSTTLVKFYGSFLGRDLLNVVGYQDDFKDVADEEYYEMEIWVCAGRTIWIGESPNTVSKRRPIYATCFQKVQKEFYGYGIAAILEDIERSNTLATRAMLLNASYSAGVMGEVDINALAEDFNPEDLFRLDPNSLIAVKPKMVGGAGRAIQFYSVPNNTAQFSALRAEFRSAAGIRTGITPNLYGVTQGSADRSAKGSAARYAQSMKLLSASILNTELHLIEPMARYMYQLNTINSDDFEEYGDLKGDCQPRARGAAGLVEKEVKKSEALEQLQLISQVIPALQQSPDINSQRLLSDVIMQVLHTMGVNITEYEYTQEERDKISMEQQAAQMSQLAAQQAQQSPTAAASQVPQPSPSSISSQPLGA